MSLENPENYGWYPPNCVASEELVPSDLIEHYRQFKQGYWGYVCPSCKYVFAPKWGGVVGAFRAHLKTISEKDGGSCSLQRGSREQGRNSES